jgi:chromosome segregation ATPase
MPVGSSSSAQAAGSALWAQLQQQLASRNADQAEQRASALRDRARVAQSVAAQAQENARSLKAESDQAQGQASEARRGVVQMNSLGEVQAQLGDLREQIGKVLQSDISPVDTVVTLAPVVNAFGQETGTLVNVTA